MTRSSVNKTWGCTTVQKPYAVLSSWREHRQKMQDKKSQVWFCDAFQCLLRVWRGWVLVAGMMKESVFPDLVGLRGLESLGWLLFSLSPSRTPPLSLSPHSLSLSLWLFYSGFASAPLEWWECLVTLAVGSKTVTSSLHRIWKSFFGVRKCIYWLYT